eukprot:TRINITY_DN13683_c0_g1_i1.p1 TRINITY_DN13683_c0_g1~~TRINITY_DN13683_c0_g1_i1.p1  ORF type:complete len:493 (+),score=256.85 TRINITY_DN13683_c0_g1_i1:125-1603(+)
MAVRSNGRVVASDHQIQLRRRQDATLQQAQAGVDEDRHLRQRAAFETRTHRRIDTNRCLRQIDGVQARHDETLELRRKRLAQLLSEEQAQYDLELEQMAETQAERRDRIAQRAVELRNERERLRRDFASQQKERAFRAGCAPLREANSRAIQLKVAADRERQLQWNSEQRDRAAREEQVYDELWEEGRLQKEARARADLARKAEMNAKLRANLDLMAQCRAEQKRQEAEAQAREDADFRDRCKKGLEEDADAERQRRLRQLDFAAKNKQYNDELEHIKSAEHQKELEQDKKFLSELVEKVRDDEERERTHKRQMRDDAVRNMREIEQQMKRQAGAETELDRLWQEENDKEWNKREARWRAEQQQRDDLLRETYRGRGAQIDEKRELLRQLKAAHADEKQKMQDDVLRLQQQDKEHAEKRFRKAAVNQATVLAQMKEKQEEAAAEKRNSDLEYVGAQLAERTFQDKVKGELALITKTLPTELSHVKIISSKPF